MGTRTIPAPNKHHIENAVTAISASMERNNVDSIDLLNELVAVHAQQAAEIHWLRGMTHNPIALEKFLETL